MKQHTLLLTLLTFFITFSTQVYSASSSTIDRIDRNSSRSPWRFSYFNLASTPIENPAEGRASIFTYNYISADYKLNYSQKYSIRPVFNFETSGYDNFGNYQHASGKLGDLYVQYVNYNLGYYPGDISLGGQFRVHLPTGEDSRNIDQIARFEIVLNFEKLLSNQFKLSYEIRPNYYWQSRRAFLRTWDNDDGTSGARVSATKEYKIEHGLEVQKMFNNTWGAGLAVGMTHQGYHGSEQNEIESRHTDELAVGLAGYLNISHRINFIASVEHESSVHNNRKGYKLGRREEVSYTLLTFFRF
jgi:hypothetical protein